jgi:hypothetical protein
VKDLDRRTRALEAKAPKAPDPDEERKARVIDDWFLAVTGKRIADMSCAELGRIEELFDGDEPMGDDASDLVLACMDGNQVVVDLDRPRQQLDRGPFNLNASVHSRTPFRRHLKDSQLQQPGLLWCSDSGHRLPAGPVRRADPVVHLRRSETQSFSPRPGE